MFHFIDLTSQLVAALLPDVQVKQLGWFLPCSMGMLCTHLLVHNTCTKTTISTGSPTKATRLCQGIIILSTIENLLFAQQSVEMLFAGNYLETKLEICFS